MIQLFNFYADRSNVRDYFRLTEIVVRFYYLIVHQNELNMQPLHVIQCAAVWTIINVSLLDVHSYVLIKANRSWKDR